ncbi:hypothetical protein [Pseudothauera rhizosphaerae]|uniref:Uncharacterized protein n=1 Tax=Pseudothauera rhizosphaerae TaxID=2565932 RepID=A0A4V3WBR5_9RHOO|nr:hypothetical protein [Pseudothauera rhizosphaerae]THF64266.1 hypothetical protein E6O51_02810 [Pseudothauera rhizosphaerae]
MSQEQKGTDLEERDGVVTMSKGRQLVALEAAWEIEALCNTLRNAVAPNDDMEHLVVRGLALRIRELARAAMSATGDEVSRTRDIARRVGCDDAEEAPA